MLLPVLEEQVNLLDSMHAARKEQVDLLQGQLQVADERRRIDESIQVRTMQELATYKASSEKYKRRMKRWRLAAIIEGVAIAGAGAILFSGIK
ncbi:hypothetical protein CAP35_13710 [Chitinophagaceae bacterium IBVUCB1]|nr:hypothetical protein CAP35_13710 [Chitinophagaceae bacterium IBVUCB1]